MNCFRSVDSRMERISEASMEEAGVSRSSSEDGLTMAGRQQSRLRQQVRRNSSGITSSSFLHKLSPDYQSVYSREEDHKRRQRDSQVYKSPRGSTIEDYEPVEHIR